MTIVAFKIAAYRSPKIVLKAHYQKKIENLDKTFKKKQLQKNVKWNRKLSKQWGVINAPDSGFELIAVGVPNSWQINDNALSEWGLRSSSDTKLLAIIGRQTVRNDFKIGHKFAVEYYLKTPKNKKRNNEELPRFIVRLKFKLGMLISKVSNVRLW